MDVAQHMARLAVVSADLEELFAAGGLSAEAAAPRALSLMDVGEAISAALSVDRRPEAVMLRVWAVSLSWSARQALGALPLYLIGAAEPSTVTEPLLRAVRGAGVLSQRWSEQAPPESDRH